MVYDECISLGGNCEIGFQFRIYDIETSHLFTWLVSDIDRIIKVTKENFKNFYTYDNLIPYTHNMVKCLKYGLCFHTKMLSQKHPVTGKLTFIHEDKVRQELHNEEMQKYLYMVEKWRKLTSSTQKTLYLIKDQNYSNTKIFELEQCFRTQYPTHSFKIVVIKEGETFSRHTLNNNVDICYVRVFSDIHISWASDLISWNQLFKHYPINGISTKMITIPDTTLKNLIEISKQKTYSFQLNFNIIQFYELLGFFEEAQYFLDKAYQNSKEAIVIEEYIRWIHKYGIDLSKSKFSYQDIKEYLHEKNIFPWNPSHNPLQISVKKELRYLRLSLQEDECLHLDEIEIYDILGKNVALNKTVKMSSTYKHNIPKTAGKSVDGIIRGTYGFHTQTEENPWVLIDLDKNEYIDFVKIYNRKGTYAFRAVSLLIESTIDMKKWELIFDNYQINKSNKK